MMSLNLHKPYPTQHHHTNNHITTRRRTHLKPSQVAVLQESFVLNTLPDATMRAQLAQDLGVTERTVQIWFQNRRAKARKLEANNNGTGLPTSLVPNVRTGWIEMPPPPSSSQTIQQPTQQAQFRSFMTPECYENEPNIKRRPRSSSKPEKTNHFLVPPTPPPQRAMSEGMGRVLSTGVASYSLGHSTTTTTTTIAETNKVSFPVTTIRIGTWARFASQTITGEWDLICFSDPLLRQLVWQVQDDGHQFRIEIDYENIRQIRLGQLTTTGDLGQLEIDLLEPVLTSFSMHRHGIDLDWVRCGDFTESQQASTTQDAHALQGSHDGLRQSLLELISQAPDLASKLVIIPDHDFLVRDLTISPSATPEPSNMAAAAYLGHHHPSTHHDFIMSSTGSGVADKNPWNTSYYHPSATTPSSTTTGQHQHQLYDQQQNWTYFNMLQQQQQQQQHFNSFI